MIENPYKGINAHVNSDLQTPGSEETGLSIWPGFHTQHMVHIADLLNENLPANYIARSEQSLQIKIQDDPEQPPRMHHPEPDISIYQREPTGSPTAYSAVAELAAPSEFPLDDTLDINEDFIKGVVIRQLTDQDRTGKIVTRIELLSPSNKPGRAGYDAYRLNRNTALYSHTPLIELDYLHEQPPPMLNYPVYPRAEKSFPYNIFINDPRPSVREGRLRAYGFVVDQAFPPITIPLADEETIEFDFGAVYQQTFTRGRWGQQIDYTVPPVRLATYSPADQQRIAAVMERVKQAAS